MDNNLNLSRIKLPETKWATTAESSSIITAKEPVDYSRRYFIIKSAQVASTVALGLFAHPLLAAASKKERVVELYVPATGESIRTVIWTPTEGYIRESIREISIVMRDRRNDKIKTIDTKTLDIVAAVQHMVKPRRPTEMLSGYRSPETNNMLRRRSKGVAKESYHLKARAIDIRMPDRSRSKVEKAARALRAGGIGRYRRNNFTHLDSGPYRTWG